MENDANAHASVYNCRRVPAKLEWSGYSAAWRKPTDINAQSDITAARVPRQRSARRQGREKRRSTGRKRASYWLLCAFLWKQLLSQNPKCPVFQLSNFVRKTISATSKLTLLSLCLKTTLIEKSKSALFFSSRFFFEKFSATSKLALLIFTNFISAKISLKIVVFSETSKFQLGIKLKNAKLREFC